MIDIEVFPISDKQSLGIYTPYHEKTISHRLNFTYLHLFSMNLSIWHSFLSLEHAFIGETILTNITLEGDVNTLI